ncbi:DUF177 domain-containing protein [Paracoccus kondratievae]|uniref:YceD family protein n=1 Tax=Paracoccus kondratievae TaxID=135740 RepID=UPI0012664B49|nr:DUF177 domain-containing protein [Paracoccus kondratievae]QFQ87233.1 DUF177 domain-containing protein [Paracoccus kondratievae]
MTTSPAPQSRFRVAHLNPRQPTEFALAPDSTTRDALADELGINALPRLRFSGSIRAIANDSWEVTGTLSARVVQPCVVTLAPVATNLQEEVHRLFSPHVDSPEGEEVEMPDEDVEPLGQFIDVEAIMVEALTLALPLYPRARGAALDAPEPKEEKEEPRKPFAGLADLIKDSKKRP